MIIDNINLKHEFDAFESEYEVFTSEFTLFNHPRFNDFHQYLLEINKLAIIFTRTKEGATQIPLSNLIKKYDIEGGNNSLMFDIIKNIKKEFYKDYTAIDGKVKDGTNIAYLIEYDSNN